MRELTQIYINILFLFIPQQRSSYLSVHHCHFLGKTPLLVDWLVDFLLSPFSFSIPLTPPRGNHFHVFKSFPFVCMCSYTMYCFICISFKIVSMVCYSFHSVSYFTYHYVFKILRCYFMSSMFTFATFYCLALSDGHTGLCPPPCHHRQCGSEHPCRCPLSDPSENFFGLSVPRNRVADM